MREILFVFIGGGLGSAARFMVAKFYQRWNPVFPFATLTVNFLSCFIFGAFIMLGANRLNITNTPKLILLTGFCGGFSTYSAFTFETAELFKNAGTGLAISNIILNFALSMGGLYLGIMLVKMIG
ncbi:MAG: CrcB family protein [Daejeonella sp.]